MPMQMLGCRSCHDAADVAEAKQASLRVAHSANRKYSTLSSLLSGFFTFHQGTTLLQTLKLRCRQVKLHSDGSALRGITRVIVSSHEAIRSTTPQLIVVLVLRLVQ